MFVIHISYVVILLLIIKIFLKGNKKIKIKLFCKEINILAVLLRLAGIKNLFYKNFP
jgi:hypothetical protein